MVGKWIFMQIPIWWITRSFCRAFQPGRVDEWYSQWLFISYVNLITATALIANRWCKKFVEGVKQSHNKHKKRTNQILIRVGIVPLLLDSILVHLPYILFCTWYWCSEACPATWHMYKLLPRIIGRLSYFGCMKDTEVYSRIDLQFVEATVGGNLVSTMCVCVSLYNLLPLPMKRKIWLQKLFLIRRNAN